MPDRSRLETVNTILERGLIARVGMAEADELIEKVTGVVDGGCTVIELTVSGREDRSGVKALMAHLRENDPVAVLGVGPVDDPGLAGELATAGIDFIASKSYNQETAKICNGRKVLYIPVVGTRSELIRAEETGVEMVRYRSETPGELKIELGGFKKSCFLPAGEADPADLERWFGAGACAVTMSPEGTQASAQALWAVSRARGLPLFSGVEHLGIYPTAEVPAADLAGYYEQTFGFDLFKGEGYYFAYSAGPGRIEILEEPEPVGCHVAIKVRNFEAAVGFLADQGIEFEPVKDFGRIKAIFLKDRDPVGNKVHLLYQAVL